MKMTVPFDTLAYARQLAKAGVPADQAELQSKLLADVFGETMAFSGDTVTLERNVLARVEAWKLKTECRISIVASEVNRMRWMLGSSIALNVAILLELFLR